MFKNILTYAQYAIPQHSLSTLVGHLADSQHVKLKNFLIKRFIKHYQVDMSIAQIEDPEQYPTFNSFFIRKLKAELRPIASDPTSIACPVDGIIAQIGKVRENQLLQAKDFFFDLYTLLGGDQELANVFYDGHFATLYLAPHNYHRVHMPLAGKLKQTIYVPGKLFSVNRMTSEIIPNLYSRNERLISLFDTKAGRMAVILIGAMIVGQIKTTWLDHPIRSNHIKTTSHSGDHLSFEKGEELGYFKLGSTAILLFEKNAIEWSQDLLAHGSGSTVILGQELGKL